MTTCQSPPIRKPFAKKLKKHSRKTLANFLRRADQALSQGGRIAFEWPKTHGGWDLPELVRFIKRHDLFDVEPQGFIFFGKGKCNLKAWRVVTSSWRLAKEPSAAIRMITSAHLSKPVRQQKVPDILCLWRRCVSHSLYARQTFRNAAAAFFTPSRRR